LLETERTRLVVDCGLGKRETLARLAAIEKNIDHVDGILITHEHIDHCNGLPQMLGMWKAPLYVTEGTLDALNRVLPETFGKRIKGLEKIEAGKRFSVGDFEIRPFGIPHDAADPIAFAFYACGTKVAIATDLGKLTLPVKVHLRGAHCLVLESNHEAEKLKVGPYPWLVKQRIMGNHGHLSNQSVSEYLEDPDGFDGCAEYVVLAHLSQENNDPYLARLSAEVALGRRPSEQAFRGQLLIATQDAPMPPLEL